MKMLNVLKQFVREDRGMETVEWAVLAALIVGSLVTVVTALGGNILNAFTNLKNATT